VERLAELRDIVASDLPRMRILRIVRDLGLPDCWVAAGFVRNCVWDHVHQHATSPLPKDIDVIWYDPEQASTACDAALEMALRDRDATLEWSVKNQARMHRRNADSPYQSAMDAMTYWPETATAVGMRLGHRELIEVAAPFGLEDLFELVVRPTQRFQTEKYPLYVDRVRSKNWQIDWPCLRIEMQS
jgi:hypothetical protein